MPRVKRVTAPVVEKPVIVQKKNAQLGMDFLSAIIGRRKEKARGLFAQALRETSLPSENISDGIIGKLASSYETEDEKTRNMLENHLNLQKGSLKNILNRFLGI